MNTWMLYEDAGFRCDAAWQVQAVGIKFHRFFMQKLLEFREKDVYLRRLSYSRGRLKPAKSRYFLCLQLLHYIQRLVPPW